MNKKNKFLIFPSVCLSVIFLLCGCPQQKSSSTSSTQTKTYTLTVHIQPSTTYGRVLLDPQGNIYTEGTVVNLTAVANSGYAFDRWEGDITGKQNPTTILMNSDKTVFAYFVVLSTSYKIFVNIEPEGSGEVGISPALNSYPEGTQVQLTANAKQGYVFSGWSGDITGTQNPITIVMNSDKHITANFVELTGGGGETTTYKLIVNVSPESAGEVSLNPIGGEYLPNTQVQLTATPNSGYIFSNWSGDIESSENPVTITMDSNKTITANFITGYILTYEINPSEGGSIVFTPQGTVISSNKRAFPPGTSVQLLAVANSGFSFDKWIGGIGSGFEYSRSNPLTIIMNSDKSVAAIFVSK